MRSSTRLTLWVLVGVGILASAKTAVTRWRAESVNRGVTIILDWEEVRALASETSTPLPELLRRYHDAGARSVAIGEDTLADLAASQSAEVLTPRRAPGTPLEMSTPLRIRDDALRTRVFDALKRKWHMELDRRETTVSATAAWTDLSTFTVGWDPEAAAAVRAAGMSPVLRAANFTGADAQSVRWTAKRIKALGGSLVIFGGDQVLGFPDSVKDVAAALDANGILFGQVEFGKQKGEDELAHELKGRLVRVHSINPTEMGRTSVPEAVDRFLRAAQERNIRALYVRALPGAPNPPVEANVEYVRQIRKSLEGNDLVMGIAHPYVDYDCNPLERCLAGLGVAAVTILAVMYAWPAAGGTLLLLMLLALFDVLAPGLPFTTLGRRLVALQGALVMPILAFLVLRASLDKRQACPDAVMGEESSLFGGVWRALPLYLCTSSLSALGGVWVVGLLSSRLGSMHILEFSGIKAQQAGAILAIAAIFYLGISSKGGFAVARARVKRRVEEIWSQPLLLGGLVIALAAMVVLAVLLARSGNDPGVGVSAMEMKFRAILDKVMGVRPRTKEFLVGHPALLLGIALMSVPKVKWGLPLLVVGAIGQVSIVNTFCHLHTPLSVSVFRVFNGLWAGAVVAFVAAFAADRLSRRTAPE